MRELNLSQRAAFEDESWRTLAYY